jgi:hypothetical protein
LDALQRLAADVNDVQDDVTRAMFGNRSTGCVFFHDSALYGKKQALDSWLCTVHWWAWLCRASPFSTKPQVVIGDRAYAVEPTDDVIKSRLSFSSFHCDILTASVVMLSFLIRFLDKPPIYGSIYPCEEHAEGDGTVQPDPLKRRDWTELTSRQQHCLQAMLELKAFDRGSRQCAEDIAVKAEGPAANVNGFKGPLAGLVEAKLAASQTGREGGYWLTESGRLLGESDANATSDVATR